jgi:hypothetical protein
VTERLPAVIRHAFGSPGVRTTVPSPATVRVASKELAGTVSNGRPPYPVSLNSCIVANANRAARDQRDVPGGPADQRAVLGTRGQRVERARRNGGEGPAAAQPCCADRIRRICAADRDGFSFFNAVASCKTSGGVRG